MDAESLASPRLYPLSFDASGGRVRLVTLDEAGYLAASFLDERLLPTVGFGEWVSLDELRRAMAFAESESDFIFHIGHVGSTLLSRLLGEDEQVFAVREPAILRTLAVTELSSQDHAVLRDHTHMFLKLWGRVFRSSQRTLLKATSFVSEMAPLMMTLNPSASAILMFDRPSIYLAAILAGEAARDELRIYAPMRLARLHRRLGGQFWSSQDLSEGELAAMGWTCEVLALAHLAEQFPERILWLEFNHFLARPEEMLSAVLLRLHGRVHRAGMETILHSPHFRRYAKAPEHAFDGQLRQKILAQAELDHGGEIRRGLAWLDAACVNHPVVEVAVRRVAGAPGSG